MTTIHTREHLLHRRSQLQRERRLRCVAFAGVFVVLGLGISLAIHERHSTYPNTLLEMLSVALVVLGLVLLLGLTTLGKRLIRWYRAFAHLHDETDSRPPGTVTRLHPPRR